MAQSDLQDLIDNPRETLDVEAKRWLDLDQQVNKAQLARHICALANHGGGYLLFGFRDDLTPEPTPGDIGAYNRDAFTAIVEKYLRPVFQCEVHVVQSSEASRRHVVVWVPGCGSSPVSSIADGPQDSNHKPQGITIATHYVRVPGPKSVPVNKPELWAPLIRRCVSNDRQQIALLVENALRGRTPPQEAGLEIRDEWHRKAFERFQTVYNPNLQWPVPYIGNHFHFTYVVHYPDRNGIEIAELPRVIMSVNHEVRDLVWTGWSMFYPFTRDPIRPYVVPVDLRDGEALALESNLMAEKELIAGLPDFWRVSTKGHASLIRPYREDAPEVAEGTDPRQPGTFLSPRELVRTLAELVRHARAFAGQFDAADSVAFLCSWRGLKGRHVEDLAWGSTWRSNRVAAVDERVISGTWPVNDLATAWPEIVADMSSRLLALFNCLSVPVAWVLEESKRFRA